MDTNNREWSFEKLVGFIRQVHDELAAQAGRAVNLSLTLRNWLIGCYIAEYELCGSDRASYGDSLLTELAKRLTGPKVSNCNRRQLYRYLRFYRLYPGIVGTMSAQLKKLLPAGGQAVEKVVTASPQLRIPPEKLIHRLSYSHLELIVDLDDDLKRTFYEIECIRGNWSVRELKRQINSLYYERSGLSKDKTKLAALVQKKHDDRGRQPTGGHSALHPKRSCACGVCSGRHGQQPVRFQVPARTAQKGRYPALFGRENTGSERWGVKSCSMSSLIQT